MISSSINNNNKMTGGRKKIEIKRIEETNSRQVAFSKRRTGLFKKASEVSVLTGAQLAILVKSPGEKIFAYGHPNVDVVINRYLNDKKKNDVTDYSVPPLAINGFNQHYLEVSRELEMEKKRKVMVRPVSGQGGGKWYEERVDEIYDVFELEQIRVSLMELRKKVETRAGELMMIQTAPRFLSTSKVSQILSHNSFINCSNNNLSGFGSSNNLSGLGSSNSLSQLGSSNNLSGLGSSNNVSEFGSSNNLSGLGSSNNLSGIGSSNNLSEFGSSNNLSGFGSSNNLYGVGSSNNLYGLGSSNDLSGVGSSNDLYRVGSSNNLSGVGASNNLSEFGSSNNLSEFGSSNNLTRLGSSNSLSGLGSSNNLSEIGSNNGAPTVGETTDATVDGSYDFKQDWDDFDEVLNSWF